jgi:putative PIN family toxin of toxin-antitoxin system
VKVVFDTNILVSALVLPGGKGEEALLRVVRGGDRLIVSRAILDELLVVLARKFARNREELARVAVFVSEIGELVHPRRRVRLLKDDADNRILECATAGEAGVIVTGDRALLGLGEFEGTRIIRLREYLALPEGPPGP